MTLEEVIQEIEHDERNKKYTEQGIPPVFQVHPEARILIVGQAPGRKVQESLIPFHDASGKKLMTWLGINETVFYSSKVGILPMDFYYPGKGKTGDLPPRKFMSIYHEKVLAFMPNIQMKVLVGNYAVRYYLKDDAYKTLTETVKHYEKFLPDFFPVVHSSPLNAGWQKKNPWFESEVVPALQSRVKNILEGSYI